MQPGEQAHSLAVFRRLQDQGETDRDLLAAALLHDVGKSRCLLRLWERVFIVLARGLAPRRARLWGQGAPRGWRRSLVVAEQHPEWGAQMAQKAGATTRTLELIRRHQEKIPACPQAAGIRAIDPHPEPEIALLIRLQSVDNER
jgi:putative nucleotidyltransferase with HDIG domain